jgi:hypothetical protein
LWHAKDELMKQRTALSVLPLFFLAAPAFAQAPAPAAPAPAPAPPAAAAPAPAAPPAAAAPAPAAPVVSEPPPGGTPPAPAGEAVPAAAPPPPAATEPGKEGAPPDKVTVSKTGFFQPSANLQVWGIAEHIGNARTDQNAWQSTFRIRRAEIKAKGEIIPKTVSYMVMFDPARLLDLKQTPVTTTGMDANGMPTSTTTNTVAPAGAQNGSTVVTGASTSILQDVQLTYMTDYADFSIGQFKIPVSLEGAGSASKLYLPERALVARRFGDRRDIGFKIEKKFDFFSYWLGIYNGEGQNNLDTNDQKDLALRVEVYPIKELTLAAVGYTAVGDRDLVGTKDRIEGDIKFEKYGLLLQAEAIRGWDVVGSAAAHTKQEGQGFYVLAGYTLFDKLQPVVRIGSVDPKVGDDEHGATAIDPNDEITAYEFGVNYYLKQHDAKLQLAGSFFDPEQKVAKTTFDLILAAQVAF